MMNVVMKVHQEQERMHRELGKLLLKLQSNMQCDGEGNGINEEEELVSHTRRYGNVIEMRRNRINCKEFCTDRTFQDMLNVGKDLFTKIKEDIINLKSSIPGSKNKYIGRTHKVPIDDVILI